jgi:gliding motility-associated-like protein
LGYCCAASGADVCIEINLTLSANASGIQLEIPTGAIPGGALFYQVGCGTSYQVGQVICLNGAGPHRITFCKPGNNTNTYRIRSIPKPGLSGRLLVTQACNGRLFAKGLDESTIVWSSVPANATFNSFLSCTSGCDTVFVTPSGTYPDTIRYRVSGSILGSCGGTTFQDTVTMRFVTNTAVSISPKPATVCFGGSNTTITANPTGGFPPYRYTWNNGDTSRTRSVGVGTYIVSMTDSANCAIVRDTIVVTAFTSAIDANAGPDTTICTRRNYAFLRGTVQAATGGQWIGGTGTFVPGRTSLTPVYYPSAAETAAQTVTLRLVTTGNGSCAPDTDAVVISIRPTPYPSFSGEDTVCQYKIQSYSFVSDVSDSVFYVGLQGGYVVNQPFYNHDAQIQVTTGSIGIIWFDTVYGNARLGVRKINKATGCDSTVYFPIKVYPATAAPVIQGSDSVCAWLNTSYRVTSNPGSSYFWLVNGGTISGSLTDTIVNVVWNGPGTGTLAVQETNIRGCDSIVSIPVRVFGNPAASITGASTICHNKRTRYRAPLASGTTYNWTVVGGILEGSGSDTAVNILWDQPGTGIVFLTMINAKGCDTTISLTVNIQTTPIPALTGPLTVCERKITSYRLTPQTGVTTSWLVTGGTIQGAATDTGVSVLWGASGSGTIRVTLTNTNTGCDSVRTYNITKNPTPVPVINGSADGCERKVSVYSVTNATGNTYQWSVSGGTIVGSATDTALSVRWGAAGTGTITVRRTNASGCDSTVSRTITIRPTPVPVISGPSAVCALKSYSYGVNSAAGNTYQWSVQGGTILTSLIDSVVQVLWDTVSSGVITVKRTNTFGCDSTVSRLITINPYTMPQVTGDDSVCERSRYTYSAAVHAGSKYKWVANGGTVEGSDSSTTVQIYWSSVGSGTLNLRETNAFGCDTNVIYRVQVNPTPTPVINGNLSVCEFKRVTYSVNALSRNTYQWVVTGGTLESPDTGTFITVLWGAQGTGSIQLHQTNAFGCDSVIQRTVTVRRSPAPAILGDTVVCEKKFTTYGVSGPPGSTYLWTVTGGTIIGSATASSINVEWQSVGNGRVQLRETNSVGCDSTIFRNISVRPTPVPAITGDLQSCEYFFKNYRVTSPKPGSTYRWEITRGTITDSSLQTVISVKWGMSGTGTLRMIETNASGCDSSVSINVQISPTPTPVISGSNIVCENKKVGYSVNLAPGTSYYWLDPVGGTILGIRTGSTVTILWGSTGTGKVRVKHTNLSGCDSTAEMTVSIQPTPVPVISGPTTVCEYTSASYSVAAGVGFTYRWTVTGGNILGASNGSNINVSWGVQGAGKVTIVQTNSLGCDSTVSITVGKRAKPRPKISGNKRSCAYSAGNVYYVSVNPNPNYSYVWKTGRGIITSGANTHEIKIEFTDPGPDSVSVTEIDNLTGCDSTVTMQLIIDSVDRAQINIPDLKGCKPFKAQFSGNRNDGSHVYRWNFGDGRSAEEPNPTHTYNRAGIFNVRVIAQNIATGCRDTTIDTLTIYDTPDPYFTWDKEGDSLYAKEDTIQFTNTSLGADSFYWYVELSPNKHDTSAFEPKKYSFEYPGVYPVKLIAFDTATGCKDSLTRLVSVRVYENLFVPTGFSPNDDGVNDIFTMSFENVTEFRMTIWSRWGEIVYETNNPNVVWDGTYKGKPLPQDVYPFVIIARGFHGTRLYRNGTITIVR